MKRGLTLIAVAVGAAGIVNCATFPVRAHNRTLSGTLASTAASLDEIMSSSTGTYIGRLLADRDSTIERWADHVTQPLSIWIDSSAAVGGAQASFPTAVRSAFAEWSRTGIPLRFTYVSSSRDADVRVHWTNHLDHKTGSTTWQTDRNGWLMNGDILLATHTSNGRELDARGMRAIALHEVGHALGLSHSTDAADIMASLVRVDQLSVPDRSTIRLLYSLPAGHVRY